MNKIFCKKLNKLGTQLPAKPFPGELGDEIYNNISKEAWNSWIAQQTMLINEKRLNLLDAEHRKTLIEEMKIYLNLNN